MNYFISENWALGLSYCYHHISNNGIRKPNTGINTNVGLIGVEYQFDSTWASASSSAVGYGYWAENHQNQSAGSGWR